MDASHAQTLSRSSPASNNYAYAYVDNLNRRQNLTQTTRNRIRYNEAGMAKAHLAQFVAETR